MPSPVKEAYFTPESLASQAQELLQAPGIALRKDPPSINPSRSALLVLDMQRYFLDEASHAYIPSAGAIIPGIARLVGAFYSRRLPVFFSRHTNTPQDAGLMATWWRELIDPQHPLSLITPLLDPSKAEIIEKPRYDAFFGTSLEERLRALRVEQVVVGGVMTHLCCETTARSAFMRGFQPFFLVDGTATYNRYFHVATLTNLSHGFAALSLVADVLAALEGG
jgi:isochorismate hydrolase